MVISGIQSARKWLSHLMDSMKTGTQAFYFGSLHCLHIDQHTEYTFLWSKGMTEALTMSLGWAGTYYIVQDSFKLVIFLFSLTEVTAV